MGERLVGGNHDPGRGATSPDTPRAASRLQVQFATSPPFWGPGGVEGVCDASPPPRGC